MQSNVPALLKVSAGRNVFSHTLAEFASIICTGPKRECWTPGAAEIRTVQWKGLPMQRKSLPVRWKGLPVQRKDAPGAAESWSLQKTTTLIE